MCVRTKKQSALARIFLSSIKKSINMRTIDHGVYKKSFFAPDKGEAFAEWGMKLRGQGGAKTNTFAEEGGGGEKSPK